MASRNFDVLKQYFICFSQKADFGVRISPKTEKKKKEEKD